jgi:hypothetical protein
MGPWIRIRSGSVLKYISGLSGSALKITDPVVQNMSLNIGKRSHFAVYQALKHFCGGFSWRPKMAANGKQIVLFLERVTLFCFDVHLDPGPY